MENILESEYIEQTRPYSNDELSDMRNNLYKKLRLGNNRATHKKCNHFYLVKENGKKEKEIIENGNHGNCSVCWKISRTDNNLKYKASELVNAYSYEFYEEPKNFTYNLYDLENVYYTWLYN